MPELGGDDIYRMIRFEAAPDSSLFSYHVREPLPDVSWALDDRPCAYVKPTWRAELMWAAHNLIAHPLCEIAYWIGFLAPPVRDAGLWLHDLTIPAHTPGTGRG
jgi:hypothetical protein